MGIAKRVVDKVKEVVKSKPVTIVKTEVKEETCSNCSDSGLQCSSCSPVFQDTLGE